MIMSEFMFGCNAAVSSTLQEAMENLEDCQMRAVDMTEEFKPFAPTEVSNH